MVDKDNKIGSNIIADKVDQLPIVYVDLQVIAGSIYSIFIQQIGTTVSIVVFRHVCVVFVLPLVTIITNYVQLIDAEKTPSRENCEIEVTVSRVHEDRLLDQVHKKGCYEVDRKVIDLYFYFLLSY